MRALMIDLRFSDGPRIVRSTGSRSRATVADMRRVLRHLWQVPPHRHLVVDVAEDRRELLDVYLAVLNGKLDDMPAASGPEDQDAAETVKTWLAGLTGSASHRHRYKQAFDALLKSVKHTPHLSDLATVLEAYKARCQAAKTPRAFNMAKAACRALLRDTAGVGRRHALYNAVADVQGMTERKRGVAPLTIDEARAVRDNLRRLPGTYVGAEAAAIWWAACWTGMGPSEYWGEWQALNDRVRILGTKRAGRHWGGSGRDVPLVVAPERPRLTKDRYAKLLRLVGAQPYQARKSYATWMEDSEIPRTRRKLYLGHSASDVTDLYERREITEFLAEDRARLLKLLGPEPMFGVIKGNSAISSEASQGWSLQVQSGNAR
jgi:hypothetical protein